MIDNKIYTGKALQEEAIIDSPSFKERIPPYFPGQALKNAIDYARLLDRPLLLRGEPGSGKTRVAQAVAYELYGDTYRSHYFEWFIKSTSKASEGLYHYDHFKRMRDIQTHVLNPTESYLELGPMGKAFKSSTKENPSIILIDEIDKADLDFPNDLLLELDQKRFEIPETGENVIAAVSPLVFITSNDEKELPNAFLRRCVFCYIELPSEDQLIKIVNAHLKRFLLDHQHIMSDKDLGTLVKQFNKLYQDMQNSQSDKNPSTSELIDWVRLIQYYSNSSLTESDKETLPYAEVLLKTLDDYKKYRNYNAGSNKQ